MTEGRPCWMWFLAAACCVACCSPAFGADKSQPRPRDVSAVTHEIDRLIDERLRNEEIPDSPAADDAEFLRRVTLDLTGRIPTYDEAVAFLDSDDPGKRRQLIDELLARESYGQHFAAIWRELIEPRDTGSTKVARDTFSPCSPSSSIATAGGTRSSATC